MMLSEGWLTVDEAAQILSVTPTQVRRLCNRGKIEHRFIISESSVLNYRIRTMVAGDDGIVPLDKVEAANTAARGMSMKP